MSHALKIAHGPFNAILCAAARNGPPEAVLAWIGHMRATGLAIDTIACNTEIKDMQTWAIFKTPLSCSQ